MEEKFQDVCLIDTLRAHGYKVDYASDGPFCAIQDGSTFLEPFGSLDKQVLFSSFTRRGIYNHEWLMQMRCKEDSRSDDMEPDCDGCQWPVRLDHRSALHRLEEGRRRVGINQSNKRHAWETACTYRTQSPLLYYEEMAVWLIDPTQRTGVFVTQGSPGGGSDLAGGSLQGLPAHLSKEVVHGLGDLRSAVQLERVCRETRELVTSPDVWIDRHAGVLPAAAVDAN